MDPNETAFSFKIVLRNVVRFRGKLRKKGAVLEHISVNKRTKAAYVIILEMRKAGFRIELKLSV